MSAFDSSYDINYNYWTRESLTLEKKSHAITSLFKLKLDFPIHKITLTLLHVFHFFAFHSRPLRFLLNSYNTSHFFLDALQVINLIIFRELFAMMMMNNIYKNWFSRTSLCRREASPHMSDQSS